MMLKKCLKMICVVLVISILCNMLPMSVLAENLQQSSVNQTTEEVQEIETKDPVIVEEIAQNRSEYTKQFRLSNGLFLSVAYPNAVHYQKDGRWEEIDNTLNVKNGSYTNTAGVWNVRFPQQLSSSEGVVIEKDGYTLSFAITGELRNGETAIRESVETPEMDVDVEAEIVPELTAAPTEALIPQTEETTAIETVLEQTAATTEETMSETVETTAEETIPKTEETTTEETIPETEETTIEDTAPPTTEPTIPETVPQTVSASNAERIEAESFAVLGAQQVSAQLIPVDSTIPEEYAQHPETIPQKIVSRLGYTNAFSDTNIIYDLQSNTVKESIELRRYQPQLRGYRYTLNTGGMVPVLAQDGSITFYTPDKSQVVMIMPAPFMVDANMNYSHDVQVNLTGKGSVYALTYLLPQDWLADSSRAWPVILDPVVQAQSTVSNIVDQNVYSLGYADSGAGILQCGYVSQVGISRAYLKYDRLPALSNADVIVKAEIRLCKSGASTSTRCVSVHKVLTNWTEGQMQWSNKAAYNTNIEDYVQCLNAGFYTWDVTDIARGWYEGENTGMMFKLPDSVEQAGVASFAQFWSADYSIYQVEEKPALFIYFRNNNGIESYWDYTSSSAGRAGTGHVNDYTGNMVWVHNDIGFGGNRMPVSISHIYNANDCADNIFGMGNGWRTNFNQRVYQWPVNSNFYVWEDSDGTSHYFYYDSDKGKYVDEDGLELTLTDTGSGNSKYVITDKNGNTTHFDTYGRLTKIQNNQQTKSAISITYTTTSGFMISTVTDGAGRVYRFTYPNNLLDRISFRGSNNTEHSYVTFGYSGSKLIRITDKDTKYCTFAYTGNLLTQAQDIDGYKLIYTYNQTENTVDTDKPNRVIKICEYDGSTLGGEINIEYAHNQTTFTDHNGDVIIKQFNDWGNTVSTQDNEGHAQYAQYAFNTANDATSNTDATAKGNQLRLASNMQNTVGNRLQYSSFENGSTWSVWPAGTSCVNTTADAYSGTHSLLFTATEWSCIMSNTFTVEPGATYTFSAYMKGVSGDTLMMFINRGTVSGPSVVATSGSTDWKRVEIKYTNTTGANVTGCAQIFGRAGAQVYIDCAQVEKSVSASRYNLIENGDFSYGASSWTVNSFTAATVSEAAVPQLGTKVMRCIGDATVKMRMGQPVNITGAAGDTFVLSGWAKGDSVSLKDDRKFGLIASVTYADGTSKDFEASFNPDADSNQNWQYLAFPIVMEKAYRQIYVKLVYDYNVNTAYFDGIQLYKEEFGNSFTYDEDGNVVSVVDLQKQMTEYEYDQNSNLTQIIQNDRAKMTYTYYPNTNNVKTATTDEGLVYSFEYDAYGNNTKVSITGSGGTISSSAAYSNSGNTLASTTDALGKVTTYGYNAQTNVLEWVQYPEDTAETRTEYTYDSMYRMATAEATTDTGLNLSASYTYTNDLLTRIQTPTTQYNFTYGDFGLRSSVKVGTQALATYHYNLEAENGETPDRNYDLDRLDYGNGDRVNYTYDSKGRLTSQTYEDGDTVTYQYDNDGALAVMVDSATGITTRYYYDFTGRTMKYTESATGYSHSVGYEYDDINNLTAQTEVINGVTHTTSYTYDQDNRVISKTTDGITVSYTYDTLGRISQQVTKNGNTTILTESYTYNANSSQIRTYRTVSSGYDVTYTYTYDDNGNILSISDGTNTTSYVYDSQNQLIRENNQAGGFTHAWTYDNAGNIQNRTEYAHTTGALGTATDTISYDYTDTNWKDKLTAYDGTAITYDELGNPESYRGKTLTWEHGRELTTLSQNGTTWTYTYDANGMRTSRTGSSGGMDYTYVYNGSQLVQMSKSGSTLSFTYDADGRPLTLSAGDVVYYYITNLQGDVLGLVDSNGNLCIRYTYDAWGNAEISNVSAGVLVDNPLTYRGYVYDIETGLYYVSSRYYDPEIGRFVNADDVDLLGANGDFASLNLFAYCGNNPVSRADSNGHFWNIVIGAVVGGLVSGVVSAVTSYVQTGSVDWGSVAINVAVGAVGGAIAATGLGPLTQAGLTAVVSGAGNYAEQVHTKGIDNVNGADVVCSALVGGGTSLLGSAAGKLIGGKLEKAGTALLSKGKDKLLTGMVRESLGQSHSSLLRQGTKYVAQATKMINTYRGISSSVGSLIGGATGTLYNALKTGVLRW